MNEIKLRFPPSAREHDYSVHVADGLIRRFGLSMRQLDPSRVLVVADRRLSRLTRSFLAELRARRFEAEVLEMTVSEDLKQWGRLPAVYSRLVDGRFDRRSILVAIGGGVIGDFVGFAASTYLRGIRWVGVPTTLLAQVDSAIGGKTGVNLPHGKNLVGTFHQPSVVLCDLEALRTLTHRDRVSGLGEILKCGLIADARLYRFLEENWKSVLDLDPKATTRAVSRCVEIKARAVARDERDETGVREVLNFGHTFGHALETLTDYRRFRHGEAVLWGMRFAAALSVERGHLRETTQRQIDSFLIQIPVPGIPKVVTYAKVIEAMSKDKKTVRGKTRFVLLTGVGKTILDREVTPRNIQHALKRMGVRIP